MQPAQVARNSSFDYTLSADGMRQSVAESIWTGTAYEDGTIDWIYDNLNRLIQEQVVGVYTDKYVYDLVGNRKYIKDAGDVVVVEYTYDNLGRRERVIVDGQVEQDFYYDAEGRVEKIYSPQDWVSYEYQPVTGRKISVSAFDAALNYDQVIPESEDTKISYTYDKLGRLYEAITHKRNGSVPTSEEKTTYTYNPVGSIETITHSVGAQDILASSYTYDALNRLIDLVNKDSLEATLSSFDYTLYADGTRDYVVETDDLGQQTCPTQKFELVLLQ